MRKNKVYTQIRLLVVIAAVALLAAELGHAATFTLTGPNQMGNTIKVAPGAAFTVNVLMDAQETGNTFEAFLGFDVSDKATVGLGGQPTLNKLTLVSTAAVVANSIDAEFNVYRSAKVATAREANNSSLGGRPYGLKVVGARNANNVGGQKTLFSATFQNNLPAGESYYIVLSDNGSGSSYTTGWKHGLTSNRSQYALKVDSTLAQIPGDANNDGMVDVGDLGILAANYGGSGKTWAQGDFNGDGLVDVGDLGILAANYGTGVNGTVDFSADYAKAFATAVEEDDSENNSTSVCGGLGLPLIAGLLLACLGLLGSIKLRD